MTMQQNLDRTTPPLLTNFKPTMVVRDILRVIRQKRRGDIAASESEWQKFKLQRGDYDDLLNLLKNDELLWAWVEDKFRYA